MCSVDSAEARTILYGHRHAPGSLLQLYINNLPRFGACTFKFRAWFTVTTIYSRTCLGACKFTFHVWFIVTIIYNLTCLEACTFKFRVWFTVTTIYSISHFGACKFTFRTWFTVTTIYSRACSGACKFTFCVWIAITQSHVLEPANLHSARLNVLRCRTDVSETACDDEQSDLFYSAGQVPQTVMDFMQMYNDHDLSLIHI